MKYKKYSKKTNLERKTEAWERKGSPVMFWNSKEKGTYDIGANQAKLLRRAQNGN